MLNSFFDVGKSRGIATAFSLGKYERDR